MLYRQIQKHLRASFEVFLINSKPVFNPYNLSTKRTQSFSGNSTFCRNSLASWGDESPRIFKTFCRCRCNVQQLMFKCSAIALLSNPSRRILQHFLLALGQLPKLLRASRLCTQRNLVRAFWAHDLELQSVHPIQLAFVENQKLQAKRMNGSFFMTERPEKERVANHYCTFSHSCSSVITISSSWYP